jgi:anthranilate phosphoribosyltransferase
VLHLEIARVYQYLLQKQKSDFMLVHALDGYDEISLTGDTKIFNKNGEKIYSAEDLNFKNILLKVFLEEIPKKKLQNFYQNFEGKGTRTKFCSSCQCCKSWKTLENMEIMTIV